jgi:hypothetical protein
VKEYLSWLDEHSTAEKEEYAEQQKKAEEEFRPFFMKLYANDSTGEPVKEPKIEEVD